RAAFGIAHAGELGAAQRSEQGESRGSFDAVRVEGHRDRIQAGSLDQLEPRNILEELDLLGVDDGIAVHFACEGPEERLARIRESPDEDLVDVVRQAVSPAQDEVGSILLDDEKRAAAERGSSGLLVNERPYQR